MQVVYNCMDSLMQVISCCQITALLQSYINAGTILLQGYINADGILLPD